MYVAIEIFFYYYEPWPIVSELKYSIYIIILLGIIDYVATGYTKYITVSYRNNEDSIAFNIAGKTV